MHSESLVHLVILQYSALGNTIHSADTIKSAETFQMYCFSKLFSNYFFGTFNVIVRKAFVLKKNFILG